MSPGTKLVSKNVKYSTTAKTNLAVGCYRVKEPTNDQEKILIIREDDKAGKKGKKGDHPVVVTELGRDNRQISVAPHPTGPTGNGKSNLDDGEVAILDLTTSGSGASTTAKKNNNAKNNKKNNKKAIDIDVSDIEEEEVLSDITYSDDSDDPSWGSRNKNKKNDPKGKKKSNKK